MARTSGTIEGKIIGVDGTSRIWWYDNQEIEFMDIITCDSKSQPGDTGAIVLDSKNMAIGMLFAGTQTEEGGISILIPIKNICDGLNVEILN